MTASVEAEYLDEDGRGVGVLDDGGEVRVADLLPGEGAEVVIEHRSRQRPLAWARIARRTSSLSGDRAQPACPAFGDCGGCRWQHWRYAAQLAGKRERLVAALTAAGISVSVAETVPSPRTLGYRNVGKYVVAGTAGAIVLGAYRPRSHHVVSTLGCRVVEPAIDRAATEAKAALDAVSMAPYNERERTGHLRYVIVRAGADGDVVITLVTTPDAPPQAIERATAMLAPKVRGVAWMKNAATTGRIVSTDITPLAGVIDTHEQVAGATLAIAPDAFFQINRDQAQAIYDSAANLIAAGPGVRVIDAFCGAGGIALSLAGAGAEVIGIETRESAVKAAAQAAREAGLSARFVRGDAAELASLARDFAPDAIAVNPPRKGLSAAAMDALLGAAPAQVVYVSCNPTSFARDAATLGAHRYRLARVIPYDLMPGTAQVETLAIFETASAMST